MRFISATTIRVVAAFAGTAAVAAIVLASSGVDEPGTLLALKVTARVAFLLFWPAYAGAGLARLLGPGFVPWRRYGRDLGLAFAAAMLVHAGLILWLCLIGAAPGRSVFLVFGPPLALVYLLTLFSIPRLQRALGRRAWLALREVGMTVIAAAFALDLAREPLRDTVLHTAEYAPFAALLLLGFLLRAVSWLPAPRGQRPGGSAAPVSAGPATLRGNATTAI